jgi:hypothetical protein
MLASNIQEGRKKGASHQLIDTLIREYAGKDYWLDFEGSDIPGIAFFFEGFGWMLVIANNLWGMY